MELNPGAFVIANAGRDKGKCFVVLSVENQYLYLCNGKNRKVSKPKKMKIKHTILTDYSNENICNLIKKGEITDKSLRSAISEFKFEL